MVTNVEIMNVENVRGYVGENGIVYLNLEDISRKLGFTKNTKYGTEPIRWDRVESYLSELGLDFPTSGKVEKQGNIQGRLPEYIPENIVYRLAMKANNQVAVSFQERIANEIIPAIRKSGMYMTPETFTRALQNPDNLALIFENYARIIRENKNLRESFEEQQEEANELYTEVEELKTDLELETTYTAYLENTLKTYVSDSDDTLSMGEFAKLVALVDKNGNYLGRNLLLQALRKERYLMDKNVPYQKYINKGYFKIFSKNINGKEIVITRITSLGRNRIPTELQQKGYRVISKY